MGVVDSPLGNLRSFLPQNILDSTSSVDVVVFVVDAIVSNVAATPTTAKPGHREFVPLEREMGSSGLISITNTMNLIPSILSETNTKPRGWG